tara:strand:+ start:530 stop:814 length:285 start_codon:yes stop_codon:yes gene_type:complete
MDQAARFTAEHTVMEAGIEIRELKHLLEVAEDKIKKLEKEIIKLKGEDDPTSMVLHFDEPLHSVASEKYNDFGITFSDKSQLDTDDEEPNNNSY